MQLHADSGIREIFACGIWNPAIGFWNSALGIQNPANDWNPESKFHWQGIWNPESKAVLDYLTSWDETCPLTVNWNIRSSIPGPRTELGVSPNELVQNNEIDTISN